MALRSTYLVFGAAGAAVFAIALLVDAWDTDHPLRRPGTAKTDQLVTIHTLPEAPDISPAARIGAADLLVAGETRTNGAQDAPPSDPTAPAKTAGEEGAAALPGANRKPGTLVYGDYAGRISTSGKLKLNRAGEGASQHLEVDVLRKRTGIKVKVPF